MRLSGPGLLARAGALLPPGLPAPAPPPRRGVRRGEWEWAAGARVPCAVWAMPGPASATGEDVLEIHLPGSQPLLDALAAALLACGVRRAEPGEFTRRAFLHGRLDLLQSEAVADLIGARTAAGARAAASALAGALGSDLATAREALAAALTEVEAGLDFEEGDSQDLRPDEIGGHLVRAEDALTAGGRRERARAERSHAEFRVVLAGAPNAGKSALLRALTGAEVLVAGEAGTTRDRVEAPWPAAGAALPRVLVDGPGLGGAPADARDAAARARAAADSEPADLTLWCVDGSDPSGFAAGPPPAAPFLLVLTKADLPLLAAPPPDAPPVAAAVSALRRDGLADLERAVARACEAAEEARAARIESAARHAEALARATEAVVRARRWHATGGAQDLIAEELRAALDELAGLAGRLAPEDLLDRIFARFCVGK